MEISQNYSSRGFTLIELMVSVAILALLGSLAAPSFRDILATQRVRSTAYSIVSDLTLARSEAVKRGTDVVLTPTTSQWNSGWRMSVVAGGEVLSTQGVIGNSVTFTTAPATVTFDRNGRSNAASTVRFELSDGSTRKRCISLDPSGRPKSAATECPT